jgi:hypothetical protein
MFSHRLELTNSDSVVENEVYEINDFVFVKGGTRGILVAKILSLREDSALVCPDSILLSNMLLT